MQSACLSHVGFKSQSRLLTMSKSTKAIRSPSSTHRAFSGDLQAESFTGFKEGELESLFAAVELVARSQRGGLVSGMSDDEQIAYCLELLVRRSTRTGERTYSPAFIRGVFRNGVRQLWRRARRLDPSRLPLRRAEDAAKADDRMVARDLLDRLLSQLGDREKEVLDLVYVRDLSAEQAASVLGCSANCVHKRLSELRKRLLSR